MLNLERRVDGGNHGKGVGRKIKERAGDMGARGGRYRWQTVGLRVSNRRLGKAGKWSPCRLLSYSVSTILINFFFGCFFHRLLWFPRIYFYIATDNGISHHEYFIKATITTTVINMTV